VCEYKLYATFFGMENTDGKWQLFCEAVNRLACEHDFHHNPTALHMKIERKGDQLRGDN